VRQPIVSPTQALPILKPGMVLHGHQHIHGRMDDHIVDTVVVVDTTQKTDEHPAFQIQKAVP